MTRAFPLKATLVLVSALWFIECDGMPLWDYDEYDYEDDEDYLYDGRELDDIVDGDIMIPPDMMLEYFNFSSFKGGEKFQQKVQSEAKKMEKYVSVDTEGRFKTAYGAVSDDEIIWKDGIIPYTIGKGFSKRTKRIIRKAMKKWESGSCLRFVPYESGFHNDYVEFEKKARTCHSSVGRQKGGGRQVINLVKWCETVGHVVHELGHTLGFWHEQNRPDRDDYLEVVDSNIKPGKHPNFVKLLEDKIDYQGTPYDFGSIMHYNLFAFSKHKRCYSPKCQTMQVEDVSKFIKQGRPDIGQRKGPSKIDLEQLNRLYSCPRKALRGAFFVKVQLGKFERNYDEHTSIYVKITVVFSSGEESIHQSSPKKADNTLVWNEIVTSQKGAIQFFRISAFISRLGEVKQITQMETVPVKPGKHSNLRNCHNKECNTFILYEYTFIPDPNQGGAMRIQTPPFMAVYILPLLININSV